MSKIRISQVLLFILAVGTGSIQAQEANLRSAETWLLGYFTQDAFLEEPHSQWFNKGFDNYQLDDKAFMDLSEISTEGLEIKVVMGTWCPDSRREVPRFAKIVQSWNFPEENITWIGVDSYKVAPIDGYEELEIDRVPTFIFYRDKIELGRIIEYPKASLERDMVNILLQE